ncbi:MAG: citramalate synthase [Clostridiales bacterium]|nr:citramalate synthase [Clostridiales bacterium]
MAQKTKRVDIFDSTLRDGAQGEGISFSVTDKLNIVKALDKLGVAYIEAGNPFSNPKELEFFEKVKGLTLKNARLTAFGSTRRRDAKVAEDGNVKSLLAAGTPVCAIFGKAWDFHATEILKTTLQENLNMIDETVSFLRENGREVVFDAEHFFDGYKHNPAYAIEALKKAAAAGASTLCLCDTNGGCFPDEIEAIVKAVKQAVRGAALGIHTHNDAALAVANSLMAVGAGATQVQGTLIGIGERTGNANLCEIIGNLQLKRGYRCIPPENMSGLCAAAHAVAEIANVRLNKFMAYVGKSAFAHKAGMHIDGVHKASAAFEHVDPAAVGNGRRFLMSEVGGRSSILEKVQKLDPTVGKDSPVTKELAEAVKALEYRGYQFEGAEASFELLVRKYLGAYKPFFKLEKFKVIAEQNTGEAYAPATALVKVSVGGSVELTAAEGNGPVNALDIALRRALERFFPRLREFKLTDYKVRILDSRETSSAVTRVLIESGDGLETFNTVGVSRDIIEASLLALVDAIEYKLTRDQG